MLKRLSWSLVVLALWTAELSASPISIIDGGILTGARNVDVLGELYDVDFVDGTCATLFNGCDDVSDFAFTDEPSARAASEALLSSVFVDGVDGMFDSHPELTFGCGPHIVCDAMTPFATDGESVYLAVAENSTGTSCCTIFTSPLNINMDLETRSDLVYARWRLASVLEPQTLWLLGVGLIALGSGLRTRRR